MARNSKKDKLNIKNFKYFMISLAIILTIFTFNITASRYMGEISSQDDLIAKPILTLSNNSLSYTENMKPGDTKIYEFEVSNKENDNTNEILLDYYFSITSTTGFTPLTIEIYDITNEETLLPLTSDNYTQVQQMNYETETTRKYKLLVIWKEENNSSEYAGKNIDFTLKLEAMQAN